MGIIRFLLSIAVVMFHLPYVSSFLDGGIAVQAFYIISGFLISYILTKENGYKTKRNFYLSRFLRLYPIYITVIILTLIFNYLFKPNFFDLYDLLSQLGSTYLVFTNIFMFGQDIVMFFLELDGNLTLVQSFKENSTYLYKGLLIPQGWTIGLELSFYLIAPFVLRKNLILGILLLFSILLKFFLFNRGYTNDPWNYHFFPAELMFFLLGSLSHRLLLPCYMKISEPKLSVISSLSVLVLSVWIIFYNYFIMLSWKAGSLFLGVLVFVIPFIFIFQNKHALDKKIGMLSYPIYISHILVLSVVGLLFSEKIAGNQMYLTIICLSVTILLSYLLLFVEKPINQLRAKLKSSC